MLCIYERFDDYNVQRAAHTFFALEGFEAGFPNGTATANESWMLTQRLLSVVALLSILVFADGCVFAGIGAGIGAAVPKYVDSVTVGSAEPNHVLSTSTDGASNAPLAGRHKVGNHWGTGFAVGAAVDIALVLIGIIAGTINYGQSTGFGFGRVGGFAGM